MIEKTFEDEKASSSATFSDCERYRYVLTRTWDQAKERVLFIMLNPSTADEMKNDPTVERCERRARAMGYGAFRVCNIFAYRATDPKVMRAESDPVGPLNDEAIVESCSWADRVVCAWGTHGAHLDRGEAVAELVIKAGIEPYHLGLSKENHPKHPLYISYAQAPVKWSELIV